MGCCGGTCSSLWNADKIATIICVKRSDAEDAFWYDSDYGGPIEGGKQLEVVGICICLRLIQDRYDQSGDKTKTRSFGREFKKSK